MSRLNDVPGRDRGVPRKTRDTTLAFVETVSTLRGQKVIVRVVERTTPPVRVSGETEVCLHSKS